MSSAHDAAGPAAAVRGAEHLGGAVHGASHAPGAASAAAEHAGGHAVPELDNFLTILQKQFGGVFDALVHYQDAVFAGIVILMLSIVAVAASRRLRKIPTGFQCLLEFYVKSMDDFARGVIGERYGRGFAPYVGTLFLYIVCMNYMGFIPFMKAPIALNINVPLALAIVTLITVHYHGIRSNGLINYLKHFIGDPWWMFPIMTPIHVMEEFAIKPGSLTLRLFGNITGEDVVIAVLVILTAGALPAFLPIPVQALFYPLALLFGLLQAFVFTILSAVYILQMTPHGEH
ncbi:MAG: F0F1 ATP synthase subunit A [bacterium]